MIDLDIIVGIDPGAAGAIVGIEDDGSIIDFILMPTSKIGKANRVNGASVAKFLERIKPQHVFIERVHAMPGGGERTMGASSAFNFGHSAGVIEGVVSCLGIPYSMITPQEWKKEEGLSGKDKDAGRARAIQLYPNEIVFHTKARGQAVADALFIARTGARRYGWTLKKH